MYKCNFPGCSFSTKYRSKLDYHHIVPREVDPKSKATIGLCKNHHALIYVPEAKSGQHSINTPESIQILQIYDSTAGKALYYENYEGERLYHFMESVDEPED